MKILITIIVVCLVLFYFALIRLPLYGWHVETSSGEHTGYVTAVEKTGLFFKTGEAHFKTDTQSSQEDSYCVMSDSVYEKLAAASRTHEKITVKFIDYLVKGQANCGMEDGVIVSIE